MSQFDEMYYLDQIDDIMSSGQGCGMMEWHQKELNELFEPLTPEQKKAVFSVYAENVLNQDGVDSDEISYIANLCGVKPKLSFE